jgi:hypothetical protein
MKECCLKVRLDEDDRSLEVNKVKRLKYDEHRVVGLFEIHKWRN